LLSNKTQCAGARVARSAMDAEDSVAQLLRAPNLAHVASLMADGSPHVVPVWVDFDGQVVRFAKERGSLGLRNLRRDPRLAISVVSVDNPYKTATVRASVVAIAEGEAARQWIEDAALRYTGRAWIDPPEMVLLSALPVRARAEHYEEFAQRVITTFALRG
jgi:PPOX class probable F420-dependent enzyme